MGWLANAIVIVGGMIKDDVSSINAIKNNAAQFGGVIGAETEYLEKHDEDGTWMFHDLKNIDLQSLTFKDIENTPLGKSMNKEIERMEAKVKRAEQKIDEVRVQYEQKES